MAASTIPEHCVTLDNVRISFPQLHEAKTVNGAGEPAFSASFLLTPNHPDIAKVEKLILEVGFAKWKDAWKRGKGTTADGSPTPGIYSILKAQGRIALHNGDEKANYEGYAGNLFISARSPTRPGVIDRDTTPIHATDDKCKSGDYVRASIQIWAMDNNYGKRICASLRWVQFLATGDRFGGGSAPISQDEYEDLSLAGEVSGGASASPDYSNEYA